jgi:lipid A disaccharide synthetase
MTAWKLLGRVLISARTFALPNVIGEAMEWGRLVPELVPHDGTPEPVLARLKPLLQDEAAREQQTERFDQLAGLFAGVHFRRAAADVLLHEIAAASGESPVPDSPDEADDDDDVS